MKRVPSFFTVIGLAAAALLSAAPSAQAIPLIKATSFSITDGIVPFMGVPAFDPALGTLDRVDIFISGAFGFHVQVNPGETVTPVLSMQMSRVGPYGFNFTTTPIVYAPATNTVSMGPIPVAYTSNFFLSMRFDALSEMLGGFTIPSISISGAGVGPLPAVAGLDNFIGTIPGQGVGEVMVLAPSGFVPFLPITGGGSMIVTYDYTPPPDPVAEPSALALIGIGLAGLGAATRRRRL